MQFVVISAKDGQRLNCHIGGLQIELCILDAGLDNIMNTGCVKETFVETLEMGRAEIGFTGDRGNVPFFVWGILDVHTYLAE